MKKIYMCIISLMGFTMQAQQHLQSINFGDMPKPVPSISSFSTYTDTPASLATGIPNISIPLFSLPADGSADLGLQLSYNPLNTNESEAASEVGTGWSLFKGGVISRQVNGLVDEIFQSTGNINYKKNEFDDEYYYNLPGLTGKFKIERDTEHNTFKIIDLTPLNHVKIEYTKQDNNATLIVDSFTITDDQGVRYYFNDYSSNAVYGGYYASVGLLGLEYKSAFFLTRIKDGNNIESASFTYKKETKYESSSFLYTTCRLEKINSPFGNIEIVYDYDQTLETTMNDPYSIKKILLNNSYSKAAVYAFEYSYPMVTYPQGTEKRRRLEKAKKMNGDNVLEEISFVYNPLLPPPSSELLYSCASSTEHYPSGVLKKIIYPSKGVSEYSYELSDTFVDRRNPPYLYELDPCVNYKSSRPDFAFHTAQNRTYTFTVSGDPSAKKKFWLDFIVLHDIVQNGPIDPHTGLPKPLTPAQMISYTLKKGNEILAIVKNEGTNIFYNYPGQYTIEATVPYVDGEMEFRLTELMPQPAPHRNSLQNSDYRIRSVKRYSDISSTVPDTSVLYSYDKFSIPNSSSGYFSQEGRTQFENVKVTDGSGNGYTQYYFKTQRDYPSYTIQKNGSNVYFQPYYNLVKTGILEKKEVYNDNNQLLAKENYEYTFAIADDTDYKLENGYYSKTAFISQTKSSSVVYPSGSASSFLSSSSETNVRADNFKPSSSKSVSADGTTTEGFYQYAQDKNHTRLLAANMTGIPLESEVKENGKTVGKSETRFDHATNLYPTSEISYNRQTQSPVTTSTFDVYDSKGNLVQATGKNGIPSTTIWGYHQTMPIAVISGASYSQVASLASVTAAVAASNADCDNPANEPALLQALETLRKDPALKDYGVTASTYDPLVGVTNSISGNGIRTVNIYDTVGRLIKVTDAEGKTLQENQYNYKH